MGLASLPLPPWQADRPNNPSSPSLFFFQPTFVFFSTLLFWQQRRERAIAAVEDPPTDEGDDNISVQSSSGGGDRHNCLPNQQQHLLRTIAHATIIANWPRKLLFKREIIRGGGQVVYADGSVKRYLNLNQQRHQQKEDKVQ